MKKLLCIMFVMLMSSSGCLSGHLMVMDNNQQKAEQKALQKCVKTCDNDPELVFYRYQWGLRPANCLCKDEKTRDTIVPK